MKAVNDDTPTEVELEKLRRAASLLSDALYRLNRARETKQRDALQMAKQKIEADLDREFKERITAATIASSKARREFEEASIRYSRQKLASYGFVNVTKWEKIGWSPDAKFRVVQQGRLEVCDHATKFPANQRQALPEPGEIFIRLYTKTGDLGQRFVRIEYYGIGERRRLPRNWYSASENPNAKKETA